MPTYMSLRALRSRAWQSLFVLLVFFTNTIGLLPQAQADDFRLPAPGVRVALSPAFNPPILKGLKVHPDNPFRFDFILDQGDSPHVIASEAKQSQQEQLKQEATRLIKYFLASLTIPEKDLWVNLSPYEKNRIVPESFGQTEMGRDLLAEDYMLKQITASLIYPEDEIGKKFWKRIYEESAKKFGTTNIPVNTFNKVWIVPEKAIVYENAKAGTAYVVESKLKVMLEQDYLALQKQYSPSLVKEGVRGSFNDVSALGSQIIREIVIPELTKEVNEGKNFTQLRQVYNSLILATWYKKKIKDSILAQVYENKKKIAGVEYKNSVIASPAYSVIARSAVQRSEATKQSLDTELIYQRYLQAFKKGAYNYIKEEIDPISQQSIPRKYFSGGVGLNITPAIEYTPVFNKQVRGFDMAQIAVGITAAKSDMAMATRQSTNAQKQANIDDAVKLLTHLLSTHPEAKRHVNNLLRPDPHYTNRDDLFGEIPAGSKYLGSGYNALVLKTPDGYALRIEWEGEPRPKVNGLLQPIETKTIGEFLVEKLPLASEIPDQDLEKARRIINTKLATDGYRLNSREASEENLGIIDGEYFAVDPGAIELIDVSQEREEDAAMSSQNRISTPEEKTKWEEGQRLINDMVAAYDGMSNVGKNLQYSPGIVHRIGSLIHEIRDHYIVAKHEDNVDTQIYYDLNFELFPALKDILERLSDYGKLDELKKFADGFDYKSIRMYKNLHRQSLLALFIQNEEFTQEFAKKINQLKKVYDRNFSPFKDIVQKFYDRAQLSGQVDAAMNTNQAETPELIAMNTYSLRLKDSTGAIADSLEKDFGGTPSTVIDIGVGWKAGLGPITVKELAEAIPNAHVIAIDNQIPDYEVEVWNSDHQKIETVLFDDKGKLLSMQINDAFRHPSRDIDPQDRAEYKRMFALISITKRSGTFKFSSDIFPYDNLTLKVVYKPILQHQMKNLEYRSGNIFNLKSLDLSGHKVKIVRIANLIFPWYPRPEYVAAALEQLFPFVEEGGLVFIGTDSPGEQYCVYKKVEHGFVLSQYATVVSYLATLYGLEKETYTRFKGPFEDNADFYLKLRNIDYQKRGEMFFINPSDLKRLGYVPLMENAPRYVSDAAMKVDPLVRHLYKAWKQKLEESRPYWRKDSRFNFLYNYRAPAIAYDPKSLPHRKIGPFDQIPFSDLPERDDLDFKPKGLAQDSTARGLARELKNALMTDPDNKDLVIIPDRWPMTKNHLIAISREELPRLEREDFLTSAFHWANRGLVIEYHWRTHVKNHYHFQMFDPADAPILKYADTFKAELESNDVRMGELTGYQVPHFALASFNIDQLKAATMMVHHMLEGRNILFFRNIFRNKNGEFIVVFFIFSGASVDFQFNTIGQIRSNNFKLTQEDIKAGFARMFVSKEYQNRLQDEFWQEWIKMSMIKKSLAWMVQSTNLKDTQKFIDHEASLDTLNDVVSNSDNAWEILLALNALDKLLSRDKGSILDRFEGRTIKNDPQYVRKIRTLNNELNEIITEIADPSDALGDLLLKERKTIHYINKLSSILRYALLEKEVDVIKARWESIFSQLKALDNPLTIVLPGLNDWLAYSATEFNPNYSDLAKALVALPSPLPSAFLYAANGPHTRTDSDEEERYVQAILINGFISYLNNGLKKLKSLEEDGKTTEFEQTKEEMRKYVAVLFNGLFMVPSGMRQILLVISEGIDDKSINLVEIIKESFELFPDLLPQKTIPAFLYFMGEFFGFDEINSMSYWVSKRKKNFTVQDVFFGLNSRNADIYMSEIEARTRSGRQFGAPLDLVAYYYKYLRNLPTVDLDASLEDTLPEDTYQWSWQKQRPIGDDAMLGHQATTKGGIDLTSDKALSVQNNGQGIKFHIDPAQLAQLQNAPGFVPVIINIQPMMNLSRWLGLNDQEPASLNHR